MQTAVTKRGQTVIPAAIRKRYHIEEGDSLVWINDGETIRVIPVARDPIRALRGLNWKRFPSRERAFPLPL
jgi:AbrB family looped-hinge helix DNA binding protein